MKPESCFDLAELDQATVSLRARPRPIAAPEPDPQAEQPGPIEIERRRADPAQAQRIAVLEAQCDDLKRKLVTAETNPPPAQVVERRRADPELLQALADEREETGRLRALLKHPPKEKRIEKERRRANPEQAKKIKAQAAEIETLKARLAQTHKAPAAPEQVKDPEEGKMIARLKAQIAKLLARGPEKVAVSVVERVEVERRRVDPGQAAEIAGLKAECAQLKNQLGEANAALRARAEPEPDHAADNLIKALQSQNARLQAQVGSLQASLANMGVSTPGEA